MSLLQRLLGGIKALLLIGAFVFGLAILWVLLVGFSAILYLPDRYVFLVPTVLTAPFGIVGTYWLLRRLTARRERTIIAVTVVLWLLIVLPVLAMPEQDGPQFDPDADFSGVVSNETPEENLQNSHEANLSTNDTVRMVFDSETGGGVRWSIQEPNGNTTRGGIDGEMPDGVRETEDSVIVYTAPQDGTYQITISAKPYSKTAYEIYIEESG